MNEKEFQAWLERLGPEGVRRALDYLRGCCDHHAEMVDDAIAEVRNAETSEGQAA